MSNYSGSEEEKLEKRREYDRIRWQDPEVRARAKARRQTPEYKAKAKESSQKYRLTDYAKAKKKEYRSKQSYKDTRRNQLLLKNFGITLKDYTEMLTSQNGVCAICFRVDPPRSLAVDHCHKTGKIRGLLCRACNVSIGLLEDDEKRLKRAIRYLKDVY